MKYVSTLLVGMSCTLLFASLRCSASVLVVPVKHQTGKYVSPDHKYIVKYEQGDASEPDHFLLSTYGLNKHLLRRSLLNLNGIDKVNGFIWLPDQPHTLILAVTRDIGKPLIVQCSVGQPLQFLFRGKLKLNDDPDLESLSLVGMSPNMKTLFYKHSYYYDIKPNQTHHDPAEHWFQLPLSKLHR